jgi:hypothetical protein
MSKQIKPNASAHRKVNPMVNVVAETLRGLGYAQLKAVKPGHAICFNEETGELVLIDQLNSDTTGNYNGLEIWKGLERIGILNKDQLYAIINGGARKTRLPPIGGCSTKAITRPSAKSDSTGRGSSKTLQGQ